MGKGKNRRYLHHLFESVLRSDPNRHKVNTIRCILTAGLRPNILIISEHDDEREALAAERELIAKWGRADLGRGPLTNMTDGGEGTSAKVFTEEYRKKLAAATSAAIAAGKLDKNIAAFKKSKLGKKDSELTRQKKAEGRRGKTHSEETKRLLSAQQRAIRETPEWKLAASLAQRGKKHTEEHTLKSVRNNPRTMRVVVDGIVYDSLNRAVATTGLSRAKIKALQKIAMK